MNRALFLTIGRAASGHAPLRHPPLPRLRRRVRRDGDLRQARLRRGRDRRHAARRPLRGGGGGCAGSCSRAAARLGELRTLARRDVALALALGAIGYGAQAGAYFAALGRLDASLLALLVYTFPAMVTVAAIALGRERASRRTAVALVLASTGLVLVLARGAARGRSTRSARRSGSPPRVVYSVYILSSEGIAARVGPLALSDAGLHRRRDQPDGRRRCSSATSTPAPSAPPGFGWLVGIAVVSTVGGDRPVLRRPAAGRADAPRRSCRPSSRSSPSRWRSWCSASRSALPSWSAARSCCSAACSCCRAATRRAPPRGAGRAGGGTR